MITMWRNTKKKYNKDGNYTKVLSINSRKLITIHFTNYLLSR